MSVWDGQRSFSGLFPLSIFHFLIVILIDLLTPANIPWIFINVSVNGTTNPITIRHFSKSKQRAQKIFEEPARITRAWQNEFLFFTAGKQTRSIIVHVESLTFHLAPLIITLRREVIQLSLNVYSSWSTRCLVLLNFTNIIVRALLLRVMDTQQVDYYICSS